MTRIDFYVLQARSQEERWQFAARLIEKAWLQHCRVLLLVESAATGAALDTLLWSFKAESFIPHSDDAALPDPVAIRQDLVSPPHRELLINLTPVVPPGFEQFQRLAEIVIQAPEVLESTRRQSGIYREMGFSVTTHKIP